MFSWEDGSTITDSVKEHLDSSVNKCKTRLVAKGFNKKVGLDFNETSSHFFLSIQPLE